MRIIEKAEGFLLKGFDQHDIDFMRHCVKVAQEKFHETAETMQKADIPHLEQQFDQYAEEANQLWTILEEIEYE